MNSALLGSAPVGFVRLNLIIELKLASRSQTQLPEFSFFFSLRLKLISPSQRSNLDTDGAAFVDPGHVVTDLLDPQN
jgi:hypothetical protein